MQYIPDEQKGLDIQRESLTKKVYFRRFWAKEPRHSESPFQQTKNATHLYRSTRLSKCPCCVEPP